jgi:hypothetical protein
MNKSISSGKFQKRFLNSFLFAALFIFTSSEVFPQTKTNLDVFYILVDSSVNDFISKIPQSEDTLNLELNLGEGYSIFENKIIADLNSSGKFYGKKNNNAVQINYIINDAKTEYGEIFRDGFFGDYFIPRTISIKGNYLIKNESSYLKEFNFSSIDTINYDEINYAENESFPFTKGDIPSEPFFQGLLEPVVAIGAAAAAVILFFSIRSK